jgi:4-hydroxy-tetrahydrodipicolinate reductase
MDKIRVVVQGALGRMGQEVIRALCDDRSTVAVGAVDLKVTSKELALPDGSSTIPLSTNLKQLLTECQPDVLVDFTVAQATMPAVRTAVKYGVNLVVGTTGLIDEEIGEIDELAKVYQIGAMLAPNFALGAVLMTHLAKIAAKHFDYAEIIELHHEKKADSPSGTSIAVAHAMLEARGKPFIKPPLTYKRGTQIDGITIHSVRLPGYLARHDIALGAPGQTLRIEHNTINRECFMPGVIMAVKRVVEHKGLIYGLDSLLGL